MEYIYSIVKKYVDEMDYENLLALGAPDDEYDNESLRISQSIDSSSSVDDISRVIMDVFGNNLGADMESGDDRQEDLVRISTLIRDEIAKA